MSLPGKRRRSRAALERCFNCSEPLGKKTFTVSAFVDGPDTRFERKICAACARFVDGMNAPDKQEWYRKLISRMTGKEIDTPCHGIAEMPTKKKDKTNEAT